MPGTRCCVATCNNSLYLTKQNRETAHVVYHRFPSDPEIRKLWIQRCGREEDWKPESSRMCSVHFTSEDYERDLRAELLGLQDRRLLKNGAVPSNLIANNEVKTPHQVITSLVTKSSLHKSQEFSGMTLTESTETSNSPEVENIPDSLETEGKLSTDLLLSKQKCKALETENMNLKAKLTSVQAMLKTKSALLKRSRIVLASLKKKDDKMEEILQKVQAMLSKIFSGTELEVLLNKNTDRITKLRLLRSLSGK